MAKSAQAYAPAKKSSAKKAARKASVKKASAKKSARSADDKYSDPALRERVKKKVMAGDKGGNPGQWSARKAQLVAHEYEAEGGGYKGGRDETQKGLKNWGDEHWSTSGGKPAKQDDGMHRYLPEKAWDELSPSEKKSTEKKKLEGSHKGKQYVSNTSAAKSARKHAQED